MDSSAGAIATSADRRRAAVAPSPLVRARAALAVVFFVNGAVLASWVPHIPAVKQRHGISEGELGLVLLCMAAGAVAALSVAGRLVGRYGSRRTTALAAIGLCIALPLPMISPTVPLLALALFALGACNGLLDVSINSQAVLVQERYGRPILSSFHGLFGLGGLVGAGAAGVAMSAGAGDRAHVLGAAVAMLALIEGVRRALLPDPGRAAAAPEHGAARPTRPILWLGGLAFAALLAEGAMADWSAVYLHEVAHGTPALAAVGFAAFSATMAAGRLSGDRLVSAFGPRAVLRVSGGLAAAGLLVALLVPTPSAAIAGCAVVGLGVANVIPVLFTRAGTLDGVAAGDALAAVTAIGYCGFLAGPPMVGVMAELTSLSLSLGIVVLGCLLIALFAGAVGADGPDR